MRALLVGYGSMGREVEKVLAARGHTVASRVDPVGGDLPSLDAVKPGQADVAIEFSLPAAVVDNAKAYARLGLSAVVGTTGWYEAKAEVERIVGSAIGYLYGPNFSLGVHIFYRIVAAATRLVNPVEEYDILGFEMHHKRKKDSPSGTALAIAKVILENSRRKKRVVTERLDRAIAPDELHFASVRGGAYPGVHTVALDSTADTIEITHTARTRGGFAVGAVMAAEWLGRRKGFFSVDAFVDEVLKA
jgi:4-hydroxy-tetrahydrodipicolinate reductase